MKVVQKILVAWAFAVTLIGVPSVATSDELYDAVMVGDLVSIDAYLERDGDPDILVSSNFDDPSDNWNGTLLQLALQARRDEIGQLVLQHGASAEPAQLAFKMSVARIAAMQGMPLTLSEVLKVNPSSILDESARASPINAASVKGHYDIVELIVEFSSERDIDITEQLNVALITAANFGYSDVSRLLIHNGAEIEGSGVINAASANSTSSFVRMLLRMGADPNFVFEKTTPLSIAVKRYDANASDANARHIVQDLIRAGANACEFTGTEVLYSAHTMYLLGNEAPNCDWPAKDN